MGFAFRLLAALLVLAGITWWWQPVGDPATSASAPEAVDTAAAPARAEPEAPPTVPPPPAVAPVALPVADPEDVETDAAPEQVGAPRLPEPDAVEVAARGTFPEEARGDAWIDASVVEASAETSDGAVDDTGAREAPPEPVDLEQSGDLVRRMLVLYDAMRE